MLTEFFLRKYCNQNRKQGLKLSAKAMEQLKSHSWPGNLRELEHAIEKTVILAESDRVSQIQLSPRSEGSAASSAASTLNLEEHEKMVIQQALREVRGNVSAAA